MTTSTPQTPSAAPLSADDIKVPAAPTEQEINDSTSEPRKNLVYQWTQRIKDARDFWQPTYERLRDDMKFAGGQQWGGDEAVNSFGLKKYVANIVPRQVGLKVATLFAKNPQVKAKRRPKMDFAVWDGTQVQLAQSQQQIMAAGQEAVMAKQAGQPIPPPPPVPSAIIQDYAAGMAKKKLFDKLAETLEMVFDFQMDSQRPSFKTQMKSLVLRACTTNVGFLKLAYRRDTETLPTSSTSTEGFIERLKRLVATAQEIKQDNTDPDSPLFEDLKIQVQELAASAAQGEQNTTLREGLVFDFPPSTAIIIDPACRCLEDFVAAEWVAQEFVMTPEQVQAQWGVDIRGSSVKQYIDGVTKDASGKETGSLLRAAVDTVKKFLGGKTWNEKAKACIWEIYSKSDQTKYVVCDGWPDFLEEPAAPDPQVDGFYPIFAFVKNRIEVEENLPKECVTCYGESDVRLMRSQQEEKNRSREALRLHRIHNKDVYVTPQNAMSPTEKTNIASARSGDFIEIAALSAGKTVQELIGVVPRNPIDKAVYDDSWVMTDVNLTVGSQDADFGNVPAGQTATGQSIAQSSRMTGLGSDVDSLDDFLTKVAKAGGEMILLEMQQNEVNRICGAGAANFPMIQSDREAIKDELYLEIEAASTGRPNKTVDVQNFTAIAPQLQSLWQMLNLDPTVLLKYAIQVADMKIDLDELIDEARSQQPAGGAGQKPPAPPEKINLNVNWKDLPPEVQEQAEAAMGFKPASPLSHVINKIGHAKATEPPPAPPQPKPAPTK